MSPYQQGIQEKILKAEEAISILHQYQKAKRKTFLSNLRDIYAATHAMVLVIEAILDIGTHILVKRYHEKVTFYTDVPQLFKKHHLFSEKFADEILGMIKFRNKAVHMYETIESERVYTYSQKAPKQFEKILKILIPLIPE